MDFPILFFLFKHPFDKSGKILGTAVEVVNDLASGETKTFTLMGTDEVTGYDNFKVQVDMLI